MTLATNLRQLNDLQDFYLLENDHIISYIQRLKPKDEINGYIKIMHVNVYKREIRML